MAHGEPIGERAVVGPEVRTLRITLDPEQIRELRAEPESPSTKSWRASVKTGLLWFIDSGLPAILTAVGLVIFFVPDLKPREPLPPPSTLGATLSDVRLEERTMRDGKPALLISYDVEFAAYKGHIGLIEWAVVDAATLQRYDLGNNRDNPILANHDGGQVIAEAPTDRASGQILVPVPLAARCVFVRVYVSEPKEDDSRTRLDYADTVPFDTHDPTNQSCAGLTVRSTPIF
jgi:hypothetical protein